MARTWLASLLFDIGCCCAARCSNSTRKAVTLFRIPKFKEGRKLWLAKRRRDNSTPSASSLLCEVNAQYPGMFLLRINSHCDIDFWYKVFPPKRSSCQKCMIWIVNRQAAANHCAVFIRCLLFFSFSDTFRCIFSLISFRAIDMMTGGKGNLRLFPRRFPTASFLW